MLLKLVKMYLIEREKIPDSQCISGLTIDLCIVSPD